MSTDARSAILGRIRTAKATGGDLVTAEAAWTGLTHGYRVLAEGSPQELQELLEDRLHDYDATTTRCRLEDAPAALAALLQEAGLQGAGLQGVGPEGAGPPQPGLRIAIPEDFDEALLGPARVAGVEFVRDYAELSPAALDNAQGVLTLSTVAIAETGTIVLQAAAGQGRRALTLVPDVHVCVLRTSDIVGTVPEAFGRLRATATLPTTFISGPSATADIEMTRIKGVHGPRFLHVLLVDDVLVDNGGSVR